MYCSACVHFCSIHQDLRVVGQREGVGGIQLQGPDGLRVGLGQEILDLRVVDQRCVGIPVEGKGQDGMRGAVIRRNRGCLRADFSASRQTGAPLCIGG